MANSRTLTRMAAPWIVLLLFPASFAGAQTTSSATIGTTNQTTPGPGLAGIKPAPMRLFEIPRLDAKPVTTALNAPRPDALLHGMEQTVTQHARVPQTKNRYRNTGTNLAVGIAIGVGVALLGFLLLFIAVGSD